MCQVPLILLVGRGITEGENTVKAKNLASVSSGRGKPRFYLRVFISRVQVSEPCFFPQLSYVSLCTPLLSSLMDTCVLLSTYNHSSQLNLALVKTFSPEPEW